MRWGEAVTLEFVKIYLKHECLWNTAHPAYKLKYQREKAYSEIIEDFKAATKKSLSLPEVKIKIKNLRTTYAQQVKLILQKSTPDFIYEPSLVWFHEMDQCLKNVTSNRSTISHSQETQEVDSSCQIWVGSDQSNILEETIPELQEPITDNVYENIKGEIKGSLKSYQRHHKKSKKKKLKHRKVIKDYSTDSSIDHAKDDEFDIYGKFIASQLRKMSLEKALRLQREIQNLVSEARLSDLNSD